MHMCTVYVYFFININIYIYICVEGIVSLIPQASPTAQMYRMIPDVATMFNEISKSNSKGVELKQLRYK